MEHPFIKQNDLKELSLEQLQEKMAKLMENLTFAYRTGNGPLIHQLSMALESYKTAYTDKMDELIKKQNIQNRINIQKDI